MASQQVQQVLLQMKQAIEKMVEDVQAVQKELGTAVNGVNALRSQLTENKLVKEELDQLEEGAKVYKLVGPVLIPQDVDEARSTVETRIGYISKELGAAENRVQTLEKTQQEKRMKLVGEQQKYQALAQQASAALVAAQ